MKRFLLFAGNRFYPGGGWDDFHGAYETEAEAEREWSALLAEWDWVQLIDVGAESGPTGVKEYPAQPDPTDEAPKQPDPSGQTRGRVKFSADYLEGWQP